MSARKKFLQVYDYITNCCFEREEEALLMLAAVAARQHVFLIGQPGTAKSMMIQKMLECFADDVEYFDKLLTKETSKDEIFGMPDIKELKQGNYKYNYKGFLPTAHFAYLDEVWKCNSGTLNALLTAINERLFHDGVDTVEIPLQTLFTASNELPQDESLQALYDRMLVRMEIPRLLKQSSKMKLIDRIDGVDPEPDPPEVLTLDVLQQAYEESKEVTFDDAARDKWAELQQKLHMEMADSVYISDRRWAMAYQGLKRVVWMNGGDKITKDDFVFLTNMLWEEPQQRSQIGSILSDYMGVLTNKAQELYNRLQSAHEDIAEGVVAASDLPDVYANAKQWKQKLDDEEGDSAVFQMYKDKFDNLFEDIKQQYLDHMGL